MSTADQSLLLPKDQFLSRTFWNFSSHRAAPAREEKGVLYQFFWARNAIYYALKALQIAPRAHVLLPAYLCTAAVEPFRYYGVQVEFYDVGRSGEPDMGEIVAKINSRTEAVLAAHYFGFPQQIGQLRAICDRHGLALIEDCAHVFRSAGGNGALGSFGDASVFSWRKFLPVYDGGELQLTHKVSPFVIKYHRETAAFTAKVIKSLLDQSLEQSRGLLTKTLRQVVECGVEFLRLLRATPPDQPLVPLDSNDSAFNLRLLDQPMSRVSRLLLLHADLEAIALRRRENFAALHEQLRSLDGITPLHNALPSDVCPWVYPLILDGMENAHLLLRKEGIPAVTWGGVRPAGVDSTLFTGASFLFENLVFLPVHQNLALEALDLIAEKVKKVRRARTTEISPEVCTHG